MEPILKSQFINFKRAFDVDTDCIPEKEARAFERFVNYVLLSVDYPDVFTADSELLDAVSVGGTDDTFLDGIGIAINDQLVRNVEEVKAIADASKKLSVEFVFIQSKMSSSFDISELNGLGTGVQHFFSDAALPENSKISELRQIKDYIYSNEELLRKIKKNPDLYLYYVATGSEPNNEHFSGMKRTIKQKLSDDAECHFDAVEIGIIGARQLIKYGRELGNNFEVQLNINDIFPLFVDPKADVKKAYAFT